MNRFLNRVLVFLATVIISYRRVRQLPIVKRLLSWCRRYSAPLSFASFILVFLTFSISEGQTYDPNYFASSIKEEQLGAQAASFIGKPQLFIGQTVLTGEVQVNAALIYTVEHGDTILSIAKRYELSVGPILKENNIEPVDAEKIRPGAELLIPAEDSDTSLAWLNTINKVKEEARKKAEQERQKQLAIQQKQQKSLFGRVDDTGITTRARSSSGYEVVTTMRGGYNGGFPGQCTWYVNYKRPDLPNGMGNGGQYYANARAKGLPTGSTPRAGALIVTTENARYGHVAYVESISGSSVTITEMNYAGPYIVTRRTLSVNDPVIKGYVY